MALAGVLAPALPVFNSLGVFNAMGSTGRTIREAVAEFVAVVRRC